MPPLGSLCVSSSGATRALSSLSSPRDTPRAPGPPPQPPIPASRIAQQCLLGSVAPPRGLEAALRENPQVSLGSPLCSPTLRSQRPWPCTRGCLVPEERGLPTLCPAFTVSVAGRRFCDGSHVKSLKPPVGGWHLPAGVGATRGSQEQAPARLQPVPPAGAPSAPSPGRDQSEGPEGDTQQPGECPRARVPLPTWSLGVLAGMPALPLSLWFLADFVLVWEEDLRLGRQQGGAGRDETDARGAWRETFLDNLRAAGLHVDQVPGVRSGHCIRSVIHHLPDKARGRGVQSPVPAGSPAPVRAPCASGTT